MIIGGSLLTPKRSCSQTRPASQSANTARDYYIAHQFNIKGLEKTHKKAAVREMSLERGDTIPEDELQTVIEKNQQLLYNTGLFTYVKVSPDTNGALMSLDIEVQERWYIWPWALFEIQEETNAQWLQDPDFSKVNLGVGVEFRNFTGWNDLLATHFNYGYIRRAAVQYQKPFLFPKLNIDAGAIFQYLQAQQVTYGSRRGRLLALRREKPVWHRANGSFSLTKRFSQYDRLQVNVKGNYVSVSDSVTELNPEFVNGRDNDEFYAGFGASFIHDTRDIRAFPRQGNLAYVVLRHAGLTGLGTSNYTNLFGGASHHEPLGPFNTSLGVYGGATFGHDVPFFGQLILNNQGEVYPPPQIRGYENYYLTGSVMGSFRSEVKLPVLPRKMVHWEFLPEAAEDFPLGFYPYAFFDGGFVTNHNAGADDSFLRNRMLYGYGVGAYLLYIYDGVLRVEASRNALNNWNLQFNFSVAIQ